jgi:tetratricopeptide (TPR) repeat protein
VSWGWWLGIVLAVVGILATWYFFLRGPSKQKVDEIHAAVVPQPSNLRPLVNWQEYYDGQIARDRFKGDYVPVRQETADGKRQDRNVLKELTTALDSKAAIVCLCAGGGYGKSRLLIELCTDQHDILFANVPGSTEDFKPLIDALDKKLTQGQVFAIDDLQKYPGLSGLVRDLLFRTKARLLVACRDPDEIAELNQDQRFKVAVVSLGRMDNVAQVVKASGKEAEKIEQISGGIPAIAELARRYGDISKITSAWDLFNSIFRDMAAKFKADGKLILAEVALRGGTAADEPPIKDNFEAMQAVERMGYLIKWDRDGKTFCRLDPDLLAEFVVRETFFPGKTLAPGLKPVLARLPLSDARDTLSMLITLHRSHELEVAADAGKMLFDELMSRPEVKAQTERPKIGFSTGEAEQAPATGPWTGTLIDMVIAAFNGFQKASVAGHLLDGLWQPALALGDPALLNNLGLVLMDTGSVDEAEKCFQKAAKLFQGPDRKQELASALGNIGLIYQDKGEPDKALKYHQDALKIDQEIGYQQGAAADLGNIGLIYQAKGEPDKALKYHQDALKIHQEIGYQQGAAQDLIAIGLVQAARGKQDNALSSYDAALRIHREIGFREGEAIALGNIGLIYQAKGEPDKALKYYLDALAIFDQVGAAHEQGITVRNLARLRNKMGREQFLAARLKLGMSQSDADKLAARLDSVKL